MFCRNCGAMVPDNSKFCPKCGAEAGPIRQSGPAKGPENGRSIQSWFGVDNILAVIATVLMLVVMAVPFVSFNYIIGTTSFTLTEALSLTDLFTKNNGLSALFIILFIVFLLLFVIFKFVGRNRVLSTIGCVGTWVLFAACVILIIISNNNADSSLENLLESGLESLLGSGLGSLVGSGLESHLDLDSGFSLLNLAVGFYVWIVAGFLELVSLGLDRRKSSAA